MRTLRIAVILFLSIVLNLQAQAQSNNSELKIGYVNPQSILANMPEMRAVQQRLQNFTARKQQELLTLEQDFQTQVAQYQQKVGVISAEAQQQEEVRLGQLQQELLQAQEVYPSLKGLEFLLLVQKELKRLKVITLMCIYKISLLTSLNLYRHCQ